MTLRVCCSRTTLALSVALLVRVTCGDCIGDSCLAESVEAPGCDADCMEEETTGADVVLLQNGLHLEGGVGHAIQKSADDEAMAEKVHTTSVASMCSGSTPAGSTNWAQYSSTGIFVDVDSSSCGFSATPVYVTSMAGGSGSFVTTGSSEVYEATNSGFRIYIYTDVTSDVANNKDWHIMWVAQPSGQQNHGDGVSCAGETGSSNWTRYNKYGVYVDVDTSSCGFSSTPVYVTSISGQNLWQTTGSSEPYHENSTYFRIYIRQDSGITPADASGWSWSVNWVADQA